IEELDDSEVADEPDDPSEHADTSGEHARMAPEAAALASRDPERQRDTDELAPHAGRRRLVLVALAFACALALILWLGLRGHDAPTHSLAIAAADAPP